VVLAGVGNDVHVGWVVLAGVEEEGNFPSSSTRLDGPTMLALILVCSVKLSMDQLRSSRVYPRTPAQEHKNTR
jgi:hypothetical protein